ncbi:N-acetyl-gamma-glutamyl-phosphate reductase [Thermocrinis albus DSM 14484]|uniref:N-acetyl-gamma-glutamyl-phosphate reductase n=1 Tax=Thermocrinis albus (strain DSM 14484 / JCM 11386 / HI 11/12) TaxID=638303 RepID=D3SPN4_THEAH|nr:N-acetyl-gamma-glutamyl-phosphate reductase [Thermocrinis albus]ADC89121.1 N-acetyl-gamma-glutamyl-phosphate reductase [Thermocrinis albus DSM 14484]
MEQTLRVCVFGVTGYTGTELLRLLSLHPGVRISSLVSSSHAGKKLGDLLPSLPDSLRDKRLEDSPSEDFDLAFLCLPHEVSRDLVPKLLEMGKKVIDLSGAYRISSSEAYIQYYGWEHPYPHLLKEAVYGLPEIFRESIRNARLVANPGCYPTAALLAIYPLMKEGFFPEWVVVDAISGVSGAGRKTSQQFHFPEMTENAFPYSVLKHRHTPEMEDVIFRLTGKRVSLRFTPRVVPMSRGMMVTVYMGGADASWIEVFRDTYSSEPFVKVVDEPPMTKHVMGTNMCLAYPVYDARTGILQVITVIDNLGKGASSQAVQNMNCMMGWNEKLGLDLLPLFP